MHWKVKVTIVKFKKCRSAFIPLVVSKLKIGLRKLRCLASMTEEDKEWFMKDLYDRLVSAAMLT